MENKEVSEQKPLPGYVMMAILLASTAYLFESDEDGS